LLRGGGRHHRGRKHRREYKADATKPAQRHDHPPFVAKRPECCGCATGPSLSSSSATIWETAPPPQHVFWLPQRRIGIELGPQRFDILPGDRRRAQAEALPPADVVPTLGF
jgi:hypothetical protein